MKPEDAVPAAASAIFGDSLALAVAYRDSLATAGVERGLIGPREVERLWDRHVLNCGVIAEAFAEGESVVDIGSGAGLPGIPLAIARDDLSITLVEPLLRRATYLQEIVDELELTNVRVVRGRAEEKVVRSEHGGADAVTSRAVAPLDRLARWSTPLLRVGGRMVAMKGSSAQTEIDAHRDTLSKLGLTDIRVKTVGGDLVDTPSTLVVAKRRDPSAGRRRPK